MLNSNSDRNENSAKTREDKILGKILGNLVILGKKKYFSIIYIKNIIKIEQFYPTFTIFCIAH